MNIYKEGAPPEEVLLILVWYLSLTKNTIFCPAAGVRVRER